MLSRMLKNVFGSRNDRVLRRLWKIVEQINALEPEIAALTDAALQQKTDEFRTRHQEGASLDQLLPEVFAVVREASKRTLGMRHFDVQLIGGMVLHGGNIAEMRTGEGKTLMSTLAVYLNAIPQKGVHVVTINDYLAKRDAEWMRPLYEFLGLTVGINLHGLSPQEKQQAYAADITYGTNNEFGFDYLRDNMVFAWNEKTQRGQYYAIVDEVDSILIDEARTPLIISGAQDESTDLYLKVNGIISHLTKQTEKEGPGDYSLDEKSKQAHLTEEGHEHVEALLMQAGLFQEGESLYDAHNIVLMHHVNAALRAHTLYHRDVDYITKNGEVIIVDEHTGRTMPGRRWSDGLHQAVEAKENLRINQENQTLASITFQNYFRLYTKLSGMTGTADTEAYEFQQIYGLEVVVIPTHKKMIREDLPDFIYMSTDEKYAAILEDIKTAHATGQPILVGTTSIETSEYLSSLLKKDNIKHNVLNAKFHEQEAQIVSEAGRPFAVTIATNMAGRGTDIVLGGSLAAELKVLEQPDAAMIEAHKKAWQERHDTVLKAGGLYVLGTERHESRRIDNQLRGRSGRQGDPGRSRFYLSLQDNLLRIFGGDRLNSIMQRLGMEQGAVLESRLLSRTIENSQRKVEAYNFDIRKQLLEYDDVANEQRKVIYQQRDDLLRSDNVKDTIYDIGEQAIVKLIQNFIPAHSMEEEWDVQGLEAQLAADFALKLPISAWLNEEETLDEDGLRTRVLSALRDLYQQKEAQMGQEVMRQFEKAVLLQTLDTCWREHLAAMDYLRQGIHLRGYAQKNPKQEYKRESFELFVQLLDKINYQTTSMLCQFQVAAQEDIAAIESAHKNVYQPTQLNFKHAAAPSAAAVALAEGEALESSAEDNVVALNAPYVRGTPKVGRNDPCPCGSTKKYKQCHGRLD